MCFEKVHMISKEHGQITCSPITTEDLVSSIGLEDISEQVELMGASGPYGKMIHREVKEEMYSLWHSRYFLNQDMTLSISSDQPSLTLSFVLKSNIHYGLGVNSWDTIREQQYNMVYLPQIACDYAFHENKEYEMFGIHYNPSYLNRWKNLFLPLKQFMNKVEINSPAMISNVHPTFTPEMKALIGDILRGMYLNSQKKIRLEAKALELLEASLEKIATHDLKHETISLSEVDFDKIRQVRTYILQHLDDPGTLKTLAREVGTNVLKLKKGFKILYGTTVFEFLRKERMQKAKKLLLESKTPVHKIALIIGYRNHSNFTVAFKRRFGYPPGMLRGRKS